MLRTGAYARMAAEELSRGVAPRGVAMLQQDMEVALVRAVLVLVCEDSGCSLWQGSS